MGTHILRTCAEDGQSEDLRPLSAYRDAGVCYVLLGEPGAGKTESFREEAEQPECAYVEARRFARANDLNQWKGKTLFLDGLDEMRAGGGDGRIPLEDICSKLKELGNPTFRVSCREADWLGAIDQRELTNAVPGRVLKVLRLQPLSDQEIQVLAAEKLGTASERLIDAARNLGLYELLSNPHNLNILFEALQAGNRPQSRREAYELACRRLVVDANEGHQLAVGGELPAEDNLLEAAGILATCYLLGNLSGYALLPAKADELNPPVTNLKVSESLPLKMALKSRLFKNEGDGHRVPDHRSTAEFLAARYLTSLVQRPHDALSWRRLLALIAASDGKPVSSLRGLWAWLASFRDEQQRFQLIDQDPVAVALYGDVRPWPTKDKAYLLKSLHEAAKRYPWIFGSTWILSPLGALATPDMTHTFRAILSSEDRDEAQQALVGCVLHALKYGERLTELADTLELVVRDISRWPTIRKSALRAWMQVAPPQEGEAWNLIALLTDIHSGKLDDPDDELLGLLLDKLYPRHITPNDVLNYLHARKDKRLIGNYYMFWTRGLVDRSLGQAEAIPTLLDCLAGKRELLHHKQHEHPVHDIVGPLLLKGVIAYGQHAAPARLYEWLGIGLDEYGFVRTKKEVREIANWLSEHPEICKAVLAEGIHRAPTDKELRNYFSHSWYQRLLGARSPSDLGLWILTQVEHTTSGIAELLFPEAVRCLWSPYGNEGLSLDQLQAWVERHPTLQVGLAEMLCCQIPDWHMEQAQQMQEWRERSEKDRAQRLTFFKGQQRSLQAGTAHPSVLYDLARAYSGLLVEAPGDTPYARLHSFLGADHEARGHEALFQAALNALTGSLERNDLPSVKDIVYLASGDKQHFVSRACLVAADELAAKDIKLLLSRDDILLGKLIAMQLTLGIGENPEWFRALQRGRPMLVAQVLKEYALPMLRAKKRGVSGIHNLAYDDAYAEVAVIAAPDLLKGFPLRAPKAQHPDLEYLLKTGLKYMRVDELLALIEQKVSLKSLEPGQRTLWLIAGLILIPSQFQARLEIHVGRSQERATQVAGFFPRHGGKWPFHQPLPVATLAWLVGLLGSRCAPYRLDGFVSPVMAMADLVQNLISGLGTTPDEEASTALRELSTKRDMRAWHNELRLAMHGQATVQREAAYRYPGVEEILHTLLNRGPSSAADLAALVLDHLNTLARRVRDGSNNEYRLYWNNPDDPRAATRRSEDDCRNLLVRDLDLLLKPYGARARKEEYLVENKRADIGAFSDRHFVPIEIKADDERNLWASLRAQLIDQYTRDPRTDGYGIYLVFWFGGKGMPPPQTGSKPQNAQQLLDRLNQLLGPEDRHRISICVIDCELPIRHRALPAPFNG